MAQAGLPIATRRLCHSEAPAAAKALAGKLCAESRLGGIVVRHEKQTQNEILRSPASAGSLRMTDGGELSL